MVCRHHPGLFFPFHSLCSFFSWAPSTLIPLFPICPLSFGKKMKKKLDFCSHSLISDDKRESWWTTRHSTLSCRSQPTTWALWPPWCPSAYPTVISSQLPLPDVWISQSLSASASLWKYTYLTSSSCSAQFTIHSFTHSNIYSLNRRLLTIALQLLAHLIFGISPWSKYYYYDHLR